jgi:hypothetical protein
MKSSVARCSVAFSLSFLESDLKPLIVCSDLSNNKLTQMPDLQGAAYLLALFVPFIIIITAPTNTTTIIIIIIIIIIIVNLRSATFQVSIRIALFAMRCTD